MKSILDFELVEDLTDDQKITQQNVQPLVEIIDNVCGASKNWAKACIYYCMATHMLKQISWMPCFVIVAPPGSGKSNLIKVIKQLAHLAKNPKDSLISCEGISLTSKESA